MITQIGSLPYLDPSQAIDYSLKHDIPFLPELPRLGEAMMEYIKTPGHLSCLQDFQAAVKGRDIAKIQGVGPATIVSAGNGRYTEKKALEMSREHMMRIMEGFDVEKLIFFLDEPSLEMVDYEAMGLSKAEYESMGFTGVDYKNLWRQLRDDAARNGNVTFGVHTCGNFNWGGLFGLDFLDVISFDASKYWSSFVKSDGYKNYRSSKKVAWGIVERGDAKNFQEGDLLTPPCGLGNLSSGEECGPILENLMKARQKV
ncbi:MAG: hypothetical protein V1813_00605 [Candidatus Aenigmatarchaeota archaeon]